MINFLSKFFPQLTFPFITTDKNYYQTLFFEIFILLSTPKINSQLFFPSLLQLFKIREPTPPSTSLLKIIILPLLPLQFSVNCLQTSRTSPSLISPFEPFLCTPTILVLRIQPLVPSKVHNSVNCIKGTSTTLLKSPLSSNPIELTLLTPSFLNTPVNPPYQYVEIFSYPSPPVIFMTFLVPSISLLLITKGFYQILQQVRPLQVISPQ